ncbi:MAG: xanthine dehydrogenase family protein molybdopterin-binding subunit, partial [Chloroflexi bacterium]|nr:xanthine dehydrogenase family protein molybdopterin-binding subunit [Chloroflexota bacterium]
MTYSGQSLKRFEDYQLLTGQGSFVDDIKLPGMLHALVLRSPHAHARIRSINTTDALSLPGVAVVITAADIEGAISDPPARREQEGHDNRAPEHPVLAKDKVCYVGQPVAVVVADDLRQAREALDLIQVDYEALPAIIDPLEATGEDALVIHQEMDTNVAMRVSHTGGDLEAAFAQADHVVRQQYQVQRLAPAPMETRGLVADYQPREDLLTVWDSTQHPHSVKDRLARLLNRPEGKLRVIAPDVGGGFGEKGSFFPEEVAIPYLSMLLERPVKWVEDREENMLAFHGRGHSVDMEVAVKSDGTILGMRVNIVSDLGAYFMAGTTTVPLLTSYRLVGPYRTPAARVELLGVLTNKPRTGPYRGAGGPEAAFCMERTIDLIAQDLDLDPAEVRSRNFITPESFPYDTPTGLTYDSGNYAQALDRALELSDYHSWRAQTRQGRGDGQPLIGIGLATVVKGTGGRGANLTDHARVIVEPSGRVTVHTGVSPHGQGTATTFSQLVADELGVTPSDVQILYGDTDALPSGGGTSASRGLVAGGSAMFYPLQEARQKLNIIAAHLLHCPAEDVDFQEGRVFNRNNPGQDMPFSHVAAAAHSEELLPPGVTPGVDISGSHTIPLSPYAFGAHVAVVEVSPDTGAVKILKYVAVHDAGRIINPMLAEGQVQGAVAQGIGQALMEGMTYTSEGQ